MWIQQFFFIIRKWCTITLFHDKNALFQHSTIHSNHLKCKKICSAWKNYLKSEIRLMQHRSSVRVKWTLMSVPPISFSFPFLPSMIVPWSLSLIVKAGRRCKCPTLILLRVTSLSLQITYSVFTLATLFTLIFYSMFFSPLPFVFSLPAIITCSRYISPSPSPLPWPSSPSSHCLLLQPWSQLLLSRPRPPDGETKPARPWPHWTPRYPSLWNLILFNSTSIWKK